MQKVPGLKGLYLATNNGQIWSTVRKRFLKPALDKDGYQKITPSIDGKKYYKRVHRLIAMTYIPNPDNKPFVNHLDEDKTNNSISNLEWCTQSENELHAWATGLKTPSENQRRITIANNKAKRKLSEHQEAEVIRLYTSKTNTQNELAKIYSISQSQISVIVNRK